MVGNDFSRMKGRPLPLSSLKGTGFDEQDLDAVLHPGLTDRSENIRYAVRISTPSPAPKA